MRLTTHRLRNQGATLLHAVAQCADHASAWTADLSRTARFLQGYLSFHPRSADLFISSYPRSGTTWMQYIVHVLVNDGDTGFEHISQVVPWFERNLSLGRVCAEDYATLGDPRVFKSHLPLRWLPNGARYIYVERDGRDVALSYFHFYRSHLGYTASFEDFFESFLQGRLQYGSWFKHRAGFHQLAHHPRLLLVRYEDLLTNLGREMGRIARFCGLQLTPERLEFLASKCSFAQMKSQQQRFDHTAGERLAQPLGSGQFIRQGTSGEYRTALSAPQQVAFETQQTAALIRPDLELNLPAFLH